MKLNHSNVHYSLNCSKVLGNAQCYKIKVLLLLQNAPNTANSAHLSPINSIMKC